MKILITGITGLIGSYLAREFQDLGEIHGLKRPESQTRLLGDLEDKITWHEGDINDYQSLEDAFEEMDMIIHAAGLVSFSPKDKERLLKINCEGSANVVNVMLEKGIKKIIHISSVAALGRTPDQNVIDENHKWVDSPWNTPYAISKYLGELEIWRGVQEGLEALVVNPSILLAKEKDQRSSTAIYNYVQKENPFYPKGSLNYIDIRDAAKLTYLLYKESQWNERFILNNKSIPYQHFFESLAKVMGKKAPKIAVNGTLINLAMAWNNFSRLFGKKSILNKQTAMLAQLPIEFNNAKISRAIDFKYTPLEETLQWAVNEK
ncbi:NAD-dependent epimerase/dehydratase family protein [Echinicola sp. CAU 1574]|uniref:NAD-dependent epimerase/dehydratase family protein n=1 Tax=Echinicola arenosa TaxID=2774144 RepID=A0ABR9AT77_9BACT|nr:NAD-dependent epimerase/dehydratase family protein [Echinicola arenosa]MBD8491073.1 NAD-dependent epimerase/dehydratase family protein [Echinicola arenosa]